MSSASGETVNHSCFSICEQVNAGTNTENLADSVCQECTSERQGHGKAFETEVVKMVGRDIANVQGNGQPQAAATTLTKHNQNSRHTDNHDFEFSRVDVHGSAIPQPKYHNSDGISIKMIKEGCSVCMGDAVRISENFATPWSILVAFYVDIITDEGVKCKCIKQAFLLNLDPVNRPYFFGNCSQADVITLRDLMKNFKIGVDGNLDALRALVVPQKAALERKIQQGDGCISLAQKISNTNKRLQCAVNGKNFKTLLTKLRDLGQVIDIDKNEYPDLFKPIVTRGSRGGRRQRTTKRRKSRRIKKTLKVSNGKRR